MRGNIGIIAVFTIVLGSLLLLIMLSEMVEPLTDFQPGEWQLANYTGFGYLSLPQQQADNFRVFNNTDCITDELTYGTDYMIDSPYNGIIVGAGIGFDAGIHGNAINMSSDGDYVYVANATDLSGNFTLTGWIQPST